MHLIPSTASVLLLSQLIYAVPLLVPRLLPIVDGITCNIAGLQIADPAQTLAAVQSGATLAPSGLTTEEFEQLLQGCLRRGARGNTDNLRQPQQPAQFANGEGTTDASENGDSAAAGSYPGFAAFSTGGPDPTTDSASAGGNSAPAADSAGDGSSASAPAGTANDVVSADPPTTNNDNNSNATPAMDATPAGPPASGPPVADATASDGSAADPPAFEPKMPASDPPTSESDPAASAPPATDNGAAAASTDTSVASPDTSTNNVAVDDANAAPPASNPPADTSASAADGNSGGDSGDSSPASASFNPDESAAVDSSSNGNDSASANSSANAASNSADTRAADAATASTDPAASADGAGADGTASPFLSYNTDAPPDTDGAEPASRNTLNFANDHDRTTNDAESCDGILCLADVVLPAGVAEAPELGSNGLTNGNPGGCPSGDIDACVDLGTR